VVTLLATGLLAVVALASESSPLRLGPAGQPRAPVALMEYLALAVLLGVVLGVLLLVSVRGAPGRLRRLPRQHPAVAVALVTGIVVVVWALSLLRRHLGGGASTPLEATRTGQPPAGAEPVAVPLEWAPLIVTLVVVLAGVALALLWGRPDRRRPASSDGPSPRELAELVDTALADVHAEPDPRRAVIAAWARMEHGLAEHDLPRHPAETPFEFVGRALARSGVPAGPATRLAGLFEHAGFSQHAVGSALRDEAVTALAAVAASLGERLEAGAR
jgi:uncharacterized protein DUF4129